MLSPRPFPFLLPKAHPEQLVILRLPAVLFELDELRGRVSREESSVLTTGNAFRAEGASTVVEEDLGEDGEEEGVAGGEEGGEL